MLPDPRKLALAEHQRWLDYLQPEGLVVSPLALVDSQVQLDTGAYAKTQDQFLDALTPDPATGEAVVADFARFARNFLGWRDELLSIFSVSSEIPDGLRISTGEHGEILQPDAAYRAFQPTDPARPWLVLVRQLPVGADLDQVPDAKQERGWVATPHQKFERLLRETTVPIGVLCNGHSIRLVYAPKGENSGWLTFPVAFMAQIAGRAVASALELLLSNRRLVGVPEPVRLPALLRKSRDYQAEVSTALSHQVLEALYELARGFQAADERAKGTLLADAWQRDPQEIYGGLITTLLRLVFLLYAEDRGLMPSGELYQRGYSVQGLFQQLRTDHERHPDTMDERFGGWPRLLALFRAVYGGCKHRKMTLPARKGHLFDPDRFPFLEGRTSNPKSEIRIPQLSDGALHRILDLLLYLDGERLSYRTLDVEQIGSVYETIMGFAVEKAPGRMIALKPKKKHGAPIHLSLDALLAAKPATREKLLAEQADTKLPPAAAKALKEAATLDDLLAALDKRIDRRATPHPVPAGSILLQPTDERRRSGSHYTPRSFTEPIVRKTLEPILDRLGRHPRPETLLDLKIADIAVGSAAFLVETCRQLADELVASWHFHQCVPVIPPDEDELLYARRLVAQRCLYGVDRNPMAVDLAKLSLWLATMARDHPFTFLDHAIKCGDSLVGLTNRQIAAFHWDLGASHERVLGQEKLEQQIAKVAALRKEILAEPEDTEFAILRKQAKLSEADAAARSIKTAGDLVIAAFFAGDKPKKRQELRDAFLERYLALQRGQNVAENLKWQVEALEGLRGGRSNPVGSGSEQGSIGEGELEGDEAVPSSPPKTEIFKLQPQPPVRPFHWEIEFPEVFYREDPGFDGIVGNPPFAGKNTISAGHRAVYPEWLKTINTDAHGNSDLVAYFFRRAFHTIRHTGTLGLIATNTIRQGDTRHTGLRWIRVLGEGTIYAANRHTKWPGEAAVIVSVVWITKGAPPKICLLDEKSVSQITAYLFHDGGDENPAPLKSNEGRAQIGYYVCGRGFTFDDSNENGSTASISEMRDLIAADSRNAERIFPYIGGSEVNDDPAQRHRRFVIYFANMSEGEALQWPDLMAILEERVKPERSNNSEARTRDQWWLFARNKTELFNWSSNATRFLFHANVSSNLAFAFLPSDVIVGAPHNVFLFEDNSAFTILQSRCHEIWTRFFASSLKDDLRYTPSDCFETFPFPPDWESNAALEEAGKTYYEFRAALMIRNDEGLTKTYNRFHDPEERSPDILHLRELHTAMDRAVLDAYGWTDLPTDCQFLLDYEEDDEADTETTGKKGKKKKKPWRYRWPDDIRDEVLARLLALNAERHQEEVRLGIAPGMKGAKKKTAAKKVAKKAASKQQDQGPDLFQQAPTAPATRQLPSVPRLCETDPNIYATALVAALLNEAKEPLRWLRLRDSFILATSPSLMLSRSLPDDKERVREWQASWNQLAGPEHLLKAILNLGGRNLAVDRTSSGEPIFALQDGYVRDPEAHVSYDAWLALKILESLNPDTVLDLGDFDLSQLDKKVFELVK
jgi:hypothetical protein